MRCFAVFILVVMTWISTAQHCAARNPAQPEGFTDGTGVLVPYGLDAQRIISLAPNITEMIYFLGLGDRLVGRSDFCNYPPAAKQVPTIGGFADASLERIVALKPELVVAYQGNDRELIDDLRKAGIKVVAFREALTLADISRQMRELCLVASAGDRLPKQIGEWMERLTRLTLPETLNARPSVFFGYPGEMSTTCGPDTFLDDLLHCAGGFNVVYEPGQHWPMVSAEFVIGARPDWLITATACSGDETIAELQAAIFKQLQGDPVWSSLPAVKQGHVLVLDSDVLLRPGPRILDALVLVREALHPGLP